MRFWVASFLLSVFAFTPSARAQEPVYLACVDCYGSASLYVKEGKKLFPGRDIRWIHIQTEKEIQGAYRPSFDATKHQYEATYQLDPDSPDYLRQIKELCGKYRLQGAIGGMETGAMRADPINEFLFKSGFIKERIGNDPSTTTRRREKTAMQLAVSEEFRIPTLLSGNADEIMEWAKGLARIRPRGQNDHLFLKPDASSSSDWLRLVLKPDASSASDLLTFLGGQNPANTRESIEWALALGPMSGGVWRSGLRAVAELKLQGAEGDLKSAIAGMLGKTDLYGNKLTKIVVQTEIVGDEYVVNTSARNGVVEIVAIWRYVKIDLLGGIHSYFVDTPIDLNSDIANELRKIMPRIHHDLGNINGPGHSELFRTASGKWFLGEMAARVGGTGLPMVDAEVWGVSHLHLNLLRILDPDRYEDLMRTFPKRMLKDAALVSLLSAGTGVFRKGAAERIRAMPGVFVPADYYAVKDGDPISKTVDLNSIAGTVFVAGSTQTVRQTTEALLRAAAEGSLYDYAGPRGGILRSAYDRCQAALEKRGLRRRILRRVESMRWAS